MPINAHPEYLNAEAAYHNSETSEEKLKALKEMIRYMPKHKGAETLRAQLKTRYKKLSQQFVKSKKKTKSQKGIKKTELQVAIIGLTNSGKSSILNSLTNAKSKIASYGFTTTKPEVGTLDYHGCGIQLIDMPPIASKEFDKGIINNIKTLLIVIEKIDEINFIIKEITNKESKKIIVFNKIDLYDENIKRKISETLKSKRYNFILVSTKTQEGLDKLKEKIMKTFPIIRIYTKNSNKDSNKTKNKKQKQDNKPIILSKNSTLKDVAEKIFHNYPKNIKYAKITGPSCKFPNQKIGLKHIVKDKDLVEFFTE